MTVREYKVSGLDLDRTLTKARATAARAQKKGLTGGYTVTTRVEYGPADEFGSRAQETYLVVEGEAPRFDGWTFVARVDYVNGQPVLTGSPFYEGPQVDRDTLTANTCDHCQVNVRRTKTVVVEKDGERKQVGTTCLKDFLGHDFTVAWLKDPFAALEEGSGQGPTYLQALTVLAYSACVVRQAGFAPVSNTEDRYPTRDSVAALMGRLGGKALQAALRDFGKPTDEDWDTAAEALEFGRTMSGDTDYAMNLRAVLADELGLFDPRYFGLVVSAVGVMVRSKSDAAQRAAEKDTVAEALYAEPGTKVEFAEATVARVTSFETAYGFAEAVTFVADGYRFKWLTSAAPEFLAEGQRVSLKGTVKGEDTWNDQVSTKLLRCKVTLLEAVAA
jgi:hypothetical protein